MYFSLWAFQEFLAYRQSNFLQFLSVNYSKVWWWARSVVPFRFVSNGFDLSPFFVAWNFHAPLKQSTFIMKKIITLQLLVISIFITVFIEFVAIRTLLKLNNSSNLSECFIFFKKLILLKRFIIGSGFQHPKRTL